MGSHGLACLVIHNANATQTQTQRNATQLSCVGCVGGGEGGLNPCSAPADAERGSRTCEVLNCQLTLSQYRIPHAVHVCFSEGCAPALDRRRESVTRRSSSAVRRRAIPGRLRAKVALRCVALCVALRCGLRPRPCLSPRNRSHFK